MKQNLILLIAILLAKTTVAQESDSLDVYKINKIVDIPLTTFTTAYSIWGMSKIYGREAMPITEISALNYNNLNSVDRSTWDNYDKKASDYLFYGSMPLPIILMVDKRIRKDALKIGMLYLQAIGSTGTLYTSSAIAANRFRPYTYNPAVDMNERTRGGGRNSFFSGHPSLVATSAFFCAKVFSDYHPKMKNKWILYSVAGSAAVTTGVLRIKAGEHFPTDVMVGVTVGTLSGILIPHFHKVTKGKVTNLTLIPNYKNMQTGLTAIYNFK